MIDFGSSLALTDSVLRPVILSLVAGCTALVVALAVPQSAGATSPYGNDVSYPQCASDGASSTVALPVSPAFGVVGVNKGLPNTTNPCLAAELAWAAAAPARAAVYVNTANPGKLASWWPTTNRTQHGARAVKNPYGACKPKQYTQACSYVYGYSMAYDDVTARVVAKPSAYTWWLDVETANTWSSSPAANRADLEGMRAAIVAAKAKVGVYATRSHWREIVGTVPASSPLASLPSWIALGGVSAKTAIAACGGASLTTKGRLTLTQFVVGSSDTDVACRTFVKTSSPKIRGVVRVGRTVTAVPGTWSPTPSLRYQWYRGTTPIAHATHAKYRVTSRDKGHTLSVRVTAKKTGYSTVVKGSKAARVRR
jgi:hypothetical protein